MAITHISDTARWVAHYRAMETDRKDAIFRDPYARRLSGLEGEQIVRTMKRGYAVAWAMIVRTAVFDDIILETVKSRGADLVVNLAAGLDARPFRLKLPPQLRWVDVDLPDILRYKSEVLAGERPVCRYETEAVDLRDAARRQALLATLGRESRRALVVTEGLLVYLTAEQVGALATDLHAQPSFHWWLLDLASPRLLTIMQKYWQRQTMSSDTRFQFAPAEGTRFFEQFGWQELEYRSALEEAHRLRREMRMMWLWRFMSRLSSQAKRDEIRRMSGMVLMERE